MRSAVQTFLAAALGLLLLAGCGGGDDGGGDCDPIAATLVSRIEVTPTTAAVADGESAQLTAKAFSCSGSQLSATFTWQSSDATTVSVSGEGLVSGVKIGGPVTVKASAQGKEGSAAISVVARSVASVRVEPATANVAVGRTSTLVAKAFDAQGDELPGRSATWNSSNAAVASVSPGGAVTGVTVGGPVTITATIEGLSGAAQVTVVQSAVATVTVSPPTSSIAAGTTVQLSAVLRDDQGSVLTGRAVTWSTSDGLRASVSNTGLVTGLLPGGPVSILATSEGRSGSAQVTVTAAPPSKVAFLVQPTSVATGEQMTPPVQVEIQNSLGGRVTNSSATVTLSLADNPGSATLSGTRSVAAVNGVATFSNLSLNRPGQGYRLAAASNGLTGATSSAFDVTAGAPVSLRFVDEPGDARAGDDIGPVAVELLDASGNRAIGSTAQIGLSLGSHPGDGTLNGDVSVSTVAGVATFTGLSLDRAGNGYTLVAKSPGLAGANSTAFDITAGSPATLAFVTQPGTTGAGEAISPAVQVAVRDAFGNLVTNASTSVTMSIGNNPGGATLGGTTTVSTSGGVATFGNLTLDRIGSDYTLIADASGLPPTTSNAFQVTAGPAVRIAFAVQPTNINSDNPFDPEVVVEVQDAFGNRVTTAGGTVTVSLRSGSGGKPPDDASLVGGGELQLLSGAATYSGMTVSVGRPRTLTLRASSSGFSNVLSRQFDVSVPF